MRKQLFPLVIALSALAVSGSAAFYSVYGLSKLFAGASTEVMIMAGSLEFAKLVVASLLYQYWDTINKALKLYLSIACFVLIVITSGGIYGFLSGAYQSTATKSELLDKSLAIVKQKQIRFIETKEDLNIEKTQLNKSISELRISLSNPGSVSYYDAEAGQVITTTSSSTRRALQAELKSTIEDRDNVNKKLEAILDSISKSDIALLDREINNEAERELGPLKYLSETTGQDMGKVVNWFLLLIIFVFDPLAIALVIAANMAFAQIKPRVKVKMSVPEGMEFNKPYPMPEEWRNPSEELIERVRKNQEKISDEVKIEKKDLVVSDLEEIKDAPKKEIGLDSFIEVMEEEDREREKTIDTPDIPVSDQSPEHELYHGKQDEVDKDKLIGMVTSKSENKRKRRIKRPAPPRRAPKQYKYKG